MNELFSHPPSPFFGGVLTIGGYDCTVMDFWRRDDNTARDI